MGGGGGGGEWAGLISPWLQQLYYVSSGLSFYFVYDFCTFVTSALASYLLRYIPFLLFMVAGSVALKIK